MSAVLFQAIYFLTLVPRIRSRLLNWNLSLGAVLSIIVIVVPLGMCLLMSLRQRGESAVVSLSEAFWKRLLIVHTSKSFSYEQEFPSHSSIHCCSLPDIPPLLV